MERRSAVGTVHSWYLLVTQVAPSPQNTIQFFLTRGMDSVNAIGLGILTTTEFIPGAITCYGAQECRRHDP